MNEFSKLQNILRLALTNERSSFYPDFYGDRVKADSLPSSLKEWRSIPFLTKKDILAKPFHERLFIPFEELDLIRATSGTTGSGIMVFPRSKSWVIPELNALGKPRLTMGFFNPFRLTSEEYRGDRKTMRSIGGDLTRLAASAALAARAGIDCVAAAPSVILAFAPHLSPLYDLEKITQLELTIDKCTTLQLQALKRLFPNARMILIYSGVEARTATVSLLGEDPEHPFAVHSLPHAYYEFIDERGDPVGIGEKGEVVLTNLHEGEAFLCIRYKTGDEAIVHAQDGLKSTFTVVGRMGGDAIRITGGEIREDEIERTLVGMGIPGLIDFKAELNEGTALGKPIPQLSILLFAENPSLLETSSLAPLFASRMKVNPNRTYEDGVARDLYAPIMLQAVPSSELHGGQKRKRLVDLRG